MGGGEFGVLQTCRRVFKGGREGGPPCDWPTLDNAIAVSTLASGRFFYYGVFSTLTNF